MDWELIEKRDGWRAEIMPDPDPFPPDEPGDDVESGVYLTTTDNRYFSRNPKLLRDEDAAAACWSFPLYMYAHSGVALSLGPFSCPWDSGQVGFVRVKREGCGFRDDHARSVAEGYVDAWNRYLSGDVWGYRVLDPDGEETHSCWGYYGDEDARIEARNQLEYEIGRRRREQEKIELCWAW